MIDNLSRATVEYGSWSAQRRRDLLEGIAATLEAAADVIVATAAGETGLGEARLRAELVRTTGQLRMFGDHITAPRTPTVSRAGDVDVTLVPVPVGAVAVFAASNFPLAFGVAGGDTASALAAGCPVVVKAHPAQPQTSELLGRLLTEATRRAPEATFTLLGGGTDVAVALVRAAPIRAVGFTGSLAGGRALMAAAASREDPIPVYAEMGSLNPVLVLPGAAGDPSNATMIAAAVTGSAGQLCTKPGLVVTDSPEFADALAGAVAGTDVGHRMLTPAMADAHARWREAAGGRHRVVAGDGMAFAVLVEFDGLDDELLEEHFGPAVVVCVAPLPEYPRIVELLPGSLTATVLATDGDLATARTMLPALAARAGRLIWNGVPTGVAVCDAMHHGGPWPATSTPGFTSVGSRAIDRFLRPVALQGVPRELWPA